MSRIKKKDHEKLSKENIRKVINLLDPSEGKPISKKEACSILNISYNTTRLNKIIEDFIDRELYIEKRKKANRGKPATDLEKREAILAYLQGDPISDIASYLYRSPAFVKDMLDNIGVPNRAVSAEHKTQVELIPDECIAESFQKGEIVWSAKYHKAAIVGNELSPEYQKQQKGLGNTNYEQKYGAKCYQIYIVESVDSEDSFFPTVDAGGFFAYSLAYDLAKLNHLEKYGVDLSKL